MAEPNSITESERRLSNSYAPQFFADKGRRETDASVPCLHGAEWVVQEACG